MAQRATLKSHEAMSEELRGASDRAAAIVIAAYVEELLLESLIDRLKLSDGKLLEELLGNGAPLSTFSNKILMAFAVGVVGATTRKDLDRIRKIRNACAHAVNPISMDAPDLKGTIEAFSPRKWGMLPDEKPWLPSEPRKRFEEACFKIASNLEAGVPRDPDDDGKPHPLLL